MGASPAMSRNCMQNETKNRGSWTKPDSTPPFIQEDRCRKHSYGQSHCSTRYLYYSSKGSQARPGFRSRTHSYTLVPKGKASTHPGRHQQFHLTARHAGNSERQWDRTVPATAHVGLSTTISQADHDDKVQAFNGKDERKSRAKQEEIINPAIKKSIWHRDQGKALDDQEPIKGRVGQPTGADHKPLLTQETKGNNASTRQRHGVRMANVTGLSWNLPIMDNTM